MSRDTDGRHHGRPTGDLKSRVNRHGPSVPPDLRLPYRPQPPDMSPTPVTEVPRLVFRAPS